MENCYGSRELTPFQNKIFLVDRRNKRERTSESRSFSLKYNVNAVSEAHASLFRRLTSHQGNNDLCVGTRYEHGLLLQCSVL